jgi:hypothetical protein
LQQKLKAAMATKAAGQSKAVAGKAAKVTTVATVDSEVKKPDQDTLKTAVAEFVPLFPTLDVNTLYTISDVQTGQAFPYHFNLPQSARVLVQLIDQSAGADMSLSLFRDDGQGNPQLIDTSDNPGNADEYLGGVLPAGITTGTWWPTRPTTRSSVLAWRWTPTSMPMNPMTRPRPRLYCPMP